MVLGESLAMPPGTDASTLTRYLHQAHDDFVQTGQIDRALRWKHTHLTIDLVPGRGAGFSLEGPTGFRFLIRSRLFSDDEYADLGQESPARAVGVQPH